MSFSTFGSLRTQLEKELDLEGEEFVAPDEMIGYWNRAVSVAEAHLATLGLKDKYLLAKSNLSTVQGTAEYSLPTNIFANKIKSIIYNFGADFYEVIQLNSSRMFEDNAFLNTFASTDHYRFFISHTVPGSEKLVLVPAARETRTNPIEIWYSRSANRYAIDSDICDLPRLCYEFLAAFVKEKVYEKESHVNYELAKADRMEKEQLMQSALSAQIDDSQMSVMEPDLSLYQESS